MDATKNRAWIALAALVLIALLAVLALLREENTTTPAAPERAAEPTAPASPALSMDEPAASSPARAATTEMSAPSSANASTAHGTTPILVVDRDTGEPVAGAEVRWSRTSDIGPLHDAVRTFVQPDLEDLLANAPPATTGVDGIVLIADDPWPAVVVAKRGGHYGEGRFLTPPELPTRVVIARDIGFDVLVVDERGEPVGGVPVGLRAAEAKTKSDLLTVETAAGTGIARFRHVQGVVGKQSPPWHAGVRISTLGENVLLAPVDLERPPTEPIRLVLPRCGAVAVRAHDLRGPVRVLENVQLTTTPAEKAGNDVWAARRVYASRMEDGRALFPFVPVGSELKVEASSSFRFAKASGPGPEVAGQVVVFDLEFEPSGPELTGRLVDERGDPIVGCEVQAQMRGKGPQGSGMISSLPIRTDEAGRFTVSLHPKLGIEMLGSLTLEPFCAGWGHGARASVDLDARLHEGANELGDVIVHPAVVIVAGRVVDDRGEPIPRAAIGVDAREGAGWRPVGGSSADAAGRYELRGNAETGTLRVRCKATGHVAVDPPEAPAGSTDVTVVITRGARIEGRVLLDPGVSASALMLRLERQPESGAEERMQERTKVGEHGMFVFACLRPGRADLVVTISGRKDPLRVVAGLQLVPGETVADARLASIDLRGLLPPPVSPR